MQGTVDAHDNKKTQIQIKVIEVQKENGDGCEDELTDHDARATGTERELIVFIEERAFRDLMAAATFADIHQFLPDAFRIHGHNAYTSSR